MRPVLLLFLLFALTAACHNEEDILPAPATSVPPPARPQTTSQVPNPSVASQSFQYGSFRSMPYRVLLPKNYDSARRYPLHIFLHGIGERGVDNEGQLDVGGAHFKADSIREAYPAFIVFPQCPDSQFWFDEQMTDKLRALIDSAATNPNVDPKKISIGGFSMGAYGTFAMVARNPHLFESAVAIAGDGDDSKVHRMKGSKWRLFAGARDTVVPSRKTERMAKALAKAGASVSFTLYPEADHGDAWVQAFAEPDFFSWLFKSEPAR